MIVIGLTGGSGTGKGEAARVFASLGASVIDADAVYHRLLRENPALPAAIGARFPGTVKDGILDRRALARIVFSSPGEKAALERIAHPFVTEYVKAGLNALSGASCPAAILDAPALFESGEDSLCDTVVGVLAPVDLRIERICARDGLGRDDAAFRISAQPCDAFYHERCGHILVNDTTLEAFERRAAALYREIVKNAVQPDINNYR